MQKMLIPLLVLIFSAMLNAQKDSGWEIRFEGNKVLKTSVLEEIVRKCEDEPSFDRSDPSDYEWCFFSNRSVFWKNGLLRGKVESASVNRVDENLIAEISIDEGRVYTYDGIEFDSEWSTQSVWDRLEKILPMKIGDPVSVEPKNLEGDLGVGIEGAHDFHLGMDIVPEFDDSNGRVRFYVLIGALRGQNYDRVEFLGNEGTRDQTIRRNMRYGKGALFSKERLKADIMRINNAGVMQPIDPEKDVDIFYGEDGRRVNIVVRMKEK